MLFLSSAISDFSGVAAIKRVVYFVMLYPQCHAECYTQALLQCDLILYTMRWGVSPKLLEQKSALYIADVFVVIPPLVARGTMLS